MLILGNTNQKDPTTSEHNDEAQELFQFNVVVSVSKPPPKQKKRKIEETLLAPDNLDSDFVGEEEREIVAEPPTPNA